jgi:type IV secretion system protein VirB10
MSDGASAPKVDVAHFELRATAPRPVRVRRGALIGVSACVVALVSGTVMLALRTPAPMAASSADDGRPADPAAANEALASAPTSYAKVPVLGPPLKGMEMLTGRPSPSDATQLPGAAGDESAGTGAAGLAASDPKAADIERSPVLVSLGARLTSSSGSDGNAVSASPLSPGANLPLAPASANDKPEDAPSPPDDPNRQGHKAAYLHAGPQGDGVNPHILIPAASPWIVSAGSIIAASLITGINSDLPGEVTAQVTENVYDSPTGHTLLIPQGAKLIGGNDSVVSYGQKRALIVWRRLILPDGGSIQLDNWPGADKSGYTGLTDTVDGHSWQLVKGVALSTLLGVGSELSYGSSDSDLARALRQSVETGTDRAGQQLVGKSLDIQPTIRVRPGWPVRVVVHQDLVLRPWLPRSAGRVP